MSCSCLPHDKERKTSYLPSRELLDTWRRLMEVYWGRIKNSSVTCRPLYHIFTKHIASDAQKISSGCPGAGSGRQRGVNIKPFSFYKWQSLLPSAGNASGQEGEKCLGGTSSSSVWVFSGWKTQEKQTLGDQSRFSRCLMDFVGTQAWRTSSCF